MTWLADVLKPLIGTPEKLPETIAEQAANNPLPFTVTTSRTCYTIETAKYPSSECRTFLTSAGKPRKVPKHYQKIERIDVIPDADGIVDFRVRGTRVSIRIVGWKP